jgi:hypothetical protein
MCLPFFSQGGPMYSLWALSGFTQEVHKSRAPCGPGNQILHSGEYLCAQ